MHSGLLTFRRILVALLSLVFALQLYATVKSYAVSEVSTVVSSNVGSGSSALFPSITICPKVKYTSILILKVLV